MPRGFSQSIEINARDTPLNQILVELRDHYGIQLSFNDKLLSQYNLSVHHRCASPEQAIQLLLKTLPLTYRKEGDIFMILPEKRQNNTTQSYPLMGQITASISHEPLPFSHIMVNDRMFYSDQTGRFSVLSAVDSLFRVQVSYLGYYVLDTLLLPGISHKLHLTPSVYKLHEIVVKEQRLDRSTQIGNAAGAMKINHQIANFLPGSGDNSIFTLLRLMPGILASSEQSNGLMIWGAYEGHSQILLDGFTIWGLKSFNDDIEAVNPLIAKNIEVFKGGYDVSYGDRVGGIVRIEGKSGNTVKPSFDLNLNNVTLNGMAELPLGRNSALLLSFRQTYFNLYDDVIPSNNKNQIISKSLIDYTVYPDYAYRDGNIKFTTRNKRGDLFYISLMRGNDQFKYTINPELELTKVSRLKSEENDQYGGSAFGSHHWKGRSVTNFTTSWSSFASSLIDRQTRTRLNNIVLTSRDDLTKNKISEFNFRVDHHLPLTLSHSLESGIGFEKNGVLLSADSSGINYTDIQTDVARVNSYLLDRITLFKGAEIKVGVRADYPFDLSKVYIQPRISSSVKVGNDWQINGAWGIYNQFVTKASVVDNLGNYRYFWTASDNQNVPVLRANHWVVGSAYQHRNFTISLEGYLRHTDGITQSISVGQRFRDLMYIGEGRSYGLDMFMKKEYRGQSMWLSYSLSKTEEKYPFVFNPDYRSAPQDQRHELKAALLLNFKPFNFSANYVFGSGFPLNSGTLLKPSITHPNYNRLDVALNYLFRIKSVSGQAGISILNLLDAQNIRYSNFEQVPVDQSTSLNIYSEAIPFSPRVSLRIIY